MMLLGLNPWINLTALVVCNVLVFVPVKYLYPSRNTRLRRLTLGPDLSLWRDWCLGTFAVSQRPAMGGLDFACLCRVLCIA